MAINHEREAISRRNDLYIGGLERIDAQGRMAIIVDDGMATGLTMRAAILHIHKQNPKCIIVAVPVASQEAMQDITPIVDDVVTLIPSKQFRGSIGAHYVKFDQVEDAEVIALLASVHES